MKFVNKKSAALQSAKSAGINKCNRLLYIHEVGGYDPICMYIIYFTSMLNFIKFLQCQAPGTGGAEPSSMLFATPVFPPMTSQNDCCERGTLTLIACFSVLDQRTLLVPTIITLSMK